MICGILITALGSGLAALLVSALAGHPPLVSLGFYSLAGCCGALAAALQMVSPPRRQG